MQYIICMSNMVVPSMSLCIRISTVGYKNGHKSFHTSIYTVLQHKVNKFFLERCNCPVLNKLEVFAVPMPTGQQIQFFAGLLVGGTNQHCWQHFLCQLRSLSTT